MPDQIDVLQLGGFTFSGFSPPDLLPIGGKQAMNVHKLPGGARVIDTLGPDEEDITWRGTFFQNDAINVCVQLDAMRRSGRLTTLTFAGQSRQVVVGHFMYSIRRYPMWVEYVITCVVNQQAPSGGGGASTSASGIDNSVSNDASQGSNIGENSTTGGVQDGTPVPGVDTGAMPFDAREVALRSPAPVPVHDDGNVSGKLVEVDLVRQRFVGRSWRNPGQQLL